MSRLSWEVLTRCTTLQRRAEASVSHLLLGDGPVESVGDEGHHELHEKVVSEPLGWIAFSRKDGNVFGRDVVFWTLCFPL